MLVGSLPRLKAVVHVWLCSSHDIQGYVRSFPGFFICDMANSPGSLCSQLSPLTFFGYQKIGGPIWSGGGVFTVEHVSMWVAIAFSAIVSRSRCSID